MLETTWTKGRAEVAGQLLTQERLLEDITGGLPEEGETTSTTSDREARVMQGIWEDFRENGDGRWIRDPRYLRTPFLGWSA